MKLSRLNGMVVGVTLLACTSLAQTEKGKWELSFAGSYNCGWITQDDKDRSSEALQIYSGTLGGGYFMTDALELKANISLLGISGGDINAYVVPLTIGTDYHFNTKNKTVPYLGLAVGAWVIGGGFEDHSTAIGGVLADGHVGIKQFVSKDVAIDLQVGYEYAPLPFVTLHNVTARIGLSILF